MTLAALRKLEAQASPGPWRLEVAGERYAQGFRGTIYIADTLYKGRSQHDSIATIWGGTSPVRYRNAELIVAMRNVMPELLQLAVEGSILKQLRK